MPTDFRRLRKTRAGLAADEARPLMGEIEVGESYFGGYRKGHHGRAHINGIEGFWSFAKQMLLKCHGVDPENFSLYLKEYEFRYNHQDEDLTQFLFDHLIRPKLKSKTRKFLP